LAPKTWSNSAQETSLAGTISIDMAPRYASVVPEAPEEIAASGIDSERNDLGMFYPRTFSSQCTHMPPMVRSFVLLV